MRTGDVHLSVHLLVRRRLAQPAVLEVAEPVHHAPGAQVDLERGCVMGGRSGGVRVAPPVELAQLRQLSKQVFDDNRFATLVLTIWQNARPIRGTPAASRHGLDLILRL
ncbi:MAG TPA: hypothetical protein VL749_00120 [Patescibacteria group bacterium]|nr:hypothetical protein [Patescibacteria group bacterium]